MVAPASGRCLLNGTVPVFRAPAVQCPTSEHTCRFRRPGENDIGCSDCNSEGVR